MRATSGGLVRTTQRPVWAPMKPYGKRLHSVTFTRRKGFAHSLCGFTYKLPIDVGTRQQRATMPVCATCVEIADEVLAQLHEL